MMGDLNIWQIMLEAGYVVKFVLLLLVLASIFSWSIVWKKFQQFKDLKNQNEEFLNKFKEINDPMEIYIKAKDHQGSTRAYLFNRGYEEWKKDTDSEKKHESLERGLRSGVLENQVTLELHLNHLASIGSVSPFIGLFGTVWGIIDAFTGLSQGGGSIEAVAPGIAEALVATAIGLAAAIPAVWFYNYFQSFVSKEQTFLESFSQDILSKLR